jgi:peptidoglycan/LPS O-acetylase OafA/YrhL
VTLLETFDRKANALNAMRLLLSVSVIMWHSFAITGTDFPSGPLRQFISSVGVDGFFAISGFLIVSSWKNNPVWWRYLAARALRIFPGFWVCLIITAFVLAPIGAMLSSGRDYLSFISLDNVSYIVNNWSLNITQYDIARTPLDVPLTGVWNGSLWTLRWEFFCYLGVLAIGMMGLFNKKLVVPSIFVAAVCGLILAEVIPLDNYWVTSAVRFGVMFAAGALLQQLAPSITLGWGHITVAGVVLGASMFLPDYRVIGAIPLAYVLIGTAALLKAPRLNLRNDISYGTYVYAFPIQQVLASAGLAVSGVPLFIVVSLVLTFPFAAASWFLVERHFKLKRGPRSIPTLSRR